MTHRVCRFPSHLNGSKGFARVTNSWLQRVGACVAVTLAMPSFADPPAKKLDVSARRGTVIAQPMLSPDAWETDLQACVLEFKARPKCMTEQLLRVQPRLVPTFESEAERVTAELTRWLGKDDLATLYRVKEQTLGEWMTIRHFILEDSQGNVRLLKISFRRVLGEWWLQGFKLVDREDIEKELGID